MRAISGRSWSTDCRRLRTDRETIGFDDCGLYWFFPLYVCVCVTAFHFLQTLSSQNRGRKGKLEVDRLDVVDDGGAFFYLLLFSVVLSPLLFCV